MSLPQALLPPREVPAPPLELIFSVREDTGLSERVRVLSESESIPVIMEEAYTNQLDPVLVPGEFYLF